MKNCWSPVKLSTLGAALPLSEAWKASKAAARPATSAMFSPRVCLPLTCEVGEGLVGVVLGGEGGGDGFEVGEVFGRPPVADAAFGVEGGALGVEGVADLVADDGADGSVVVRRRGPWDRRRAAAGWRRGS